MSVFDDHLNSSQLRSDADKLILESYKISNSGNTLIPKEGRFALTKEQKKLMRRPSKTDKLPTGTFKEEHSIFRSMYGGVKNEAIAKRTYQMFENIIRDMNLPCLVYNMKRYYQANRYIKRQIASQIHSKLNIQTYD